MARPNYRERERSRSPGRRRPAGIHTRTFDGNNASHASADGEMLELERYLDSRMKDVFNELVSPPGHA
jgi:hypothetical protein